MINKTYKYLLVAIILGLIIFSPQNYLLAVSGKISGKVTDKKTGEPLYCVNVIIEGEDIGAATDLDGFYFILNVPPGTYTMKASMIGYVSVRQVDVHVAIGLATTINFELERKLVDMDEIVVQAKRPIVVPDVSANVANISSQEIGTLPIVNLAQAISLQAGVERGLTVRGGSNEQLAFVVDGNYMRDSRNNKAFSTISITSLNELQIQTGGFSSEYGNLRSGLVNIVTIEPDKNKYSADIMFQYSSPHSFSFDGRIAKSVDGYWWRPYTDPEVAFVGTKAKDKDGNLIWDEYTRRQYPRFEGWNKVAKKYNKGKSANEQLTAKQLQQVFYYHSRKNSEITEPTYNLDMTVGGPIIPTDFNKSLGDACFLLSYVRKQEPYFYPQVRKVLAENYLHGKIISNTSGNTKLEFRGMWDKQEGLAYGEISGITTNIEDPNPQLAGIPSYSWDVTIPYTMLYDNSGDVGRSMIFGKERYSITDVTRWMLGANITHVLNSSSFYEVKINRSVESYKTGPSRLRNSEIVKVIGSLGLDEAPYGWTAEGLTSIGSDLRIGGFMARARDTSSTVSWSGEFNYTNQINSWLELETGMQFQRNQINMRHALVDSVQVELTMGRQHWTRYIDEAAFYLQSKFEFEDMIANIGLRAEYFQPEGEWITYDTYERAFTAANAIKRDEMLKTIPIKGQLSLSPRIGFSFPITTSSKLYFNYGHFLQMPSAREIFEINKLWLGDIGNVGNPMIPLTKTVAYEVGYDQNLLDQFLIRLSGYYRDNSNEASQINYFSIDGLVNYKVDKPYGYSDVRGFEVSFNKIKGNWLHGFVNYTYMQYKGGIFGYLMQHENVVTQRTYESGSTDNYQNKPVSEPYASLNLDLFTPKPKEGENVFRKFWKDVHFNFIGQWRKGQAFTWLGPSGTARNIQYNIRMRDYWNIDLRMSKDFNLDFGKLNLYVDFVNVLNFKYMFFGGIFEGTSDYEDYMCSLHMSESVFNGFTPTYVNVPGDDKPGDYREYDDTFVPIEAYSDEDGFPNRAHRLETDRRVLYYSKSTGNYYEFNDDGDLELADKSFVNNVLENKLYIDMPNLRHRTFLNPLNLRFGISLSF